MDHDRGGAPKGGAKHTSGGVTDEWPCTDPLAMTAEELERFLTSVPSPVTYIAVAPARTAARRWYAMYEFHDVGVFFDGGRILFGQSRHTRAVSDEAFQVDFEGSVQEYEFTGSEWERREAKTTYTFRAPPQPGHPLVYVKDNVAVLRALLATDSKTLPPRTPDDGMDYALGM